MEASARAKLKQLIEDNKVLSLSVLVEGAPTVGLLAYAPMPDLSAVLIHASKLARHSRGLQSGAPFAILIHDNVLSDDDPLQVPRVSFEGVVRRIEPDSAEGQELRQIYVRRFPASDMMFGFVDFSLYSLALDHGRFVEGFARALDVGREDLR